MPCYILLKTSHLMQLSSICQMHIFLMSL